MLIFDNPYGALSPDGAMIAFRGDDGDIWIVDLTSGAARNLTNSPDLYEWSPIWWPERLDVLVAGTNAEMDYGALTIVHLDGSAPRILDAGSAPSSRPSPSPNGHTIAYDSTGTPWLYHLGWGREAFDPAAYGLQFSENAKLTSPSWSPDGSELVWLVDDENEGDWSEGIAIFNLRTGRARLLHVYEPAGVGDFPPGPRWSPDGQWLAFVEWPQSQDSGLWVMRPDGSDEKFLHSTTWHPGGPVWSRDSRWLVFSTLSTNAGGGPGAWLVEVGTWNLQQLALPADAKVVAWQE